MAVVAGLLALAATWGLAEPAGACLCGDSGVGVQLARADAAFVGTVVEVDPGSAEADQYEHTVLTYDVHRVFAGEVPERVELVLTGTDCNSNPHEGERGLVFASFDLAELVADAEPWGTVPPPAQPRGLEPGQLADTDCGGTRPLAAQEALPAGLGDGAPPTPLPPGATSNDLPWWFLGGLAALLVVGTVVALLQGRTRTTRPARQWEDGLDDDGHAGGR